MEIRENYIELAIDEAIKLDLPDDIGKFGTKVILSHEALGDILIKNKILNFIKSSEITEKEIKEWQEVKEYLENLDWDQARKRVHILSEESIFDCH